MPKQTTTARLFRVFAVIGAVAGPPHILAQPGYALSAPPLELVSSEEKFRPFADTMRREVERLLESPSHIDDLATLRMILAMRVHLAHYFGDDERAVATAAWIRSLQSNAAERSYTGLTTLASVAARRAHPDARPDTAPFREMYSRALKQALTTLPRTPEVTNVLRTQRDRLTATTESALLDEAREKIARAIVERGHCGLEEADQIIRTRHRLVNILPLKGATLAALDSAIMERESQ